MNRHVWFTCFALGLFVLIGFACGGGGGGGNNNSLLNGDYTYINLNGNTGISQSAEVNTGTANFDGTGIVTPDGGTGETYLVTTSNKLTFGEFTGQVSTNGEFFVAADTIDDGNVQLIIAVKQTSSATNLLIGGDYIAGSFTYDTDTSATYAFDGLVDNTAPDISLSGVAPPAAPDLFSDYAISGDGSVVFAAGGTTFFDLAGQVSPDGKIIISADNDFASDSFVSASMMLALPGSGMNNTSLSGAYAMFQFMDDDVGNSGGAFQTAAYDLTFNGSGTVTFTEVSGSNPCDPLTPGECSGSVNYTVNPDGTFTLDEPGVVLADGTIAMSVETDTSNNAIDVKIIVEKP